MVRIFTMIIDDEAQANLQANACSNEGGNVIITARTLQEAQELIRQGEEKLNEAMQTWKPEEGQGEPATDPKHSKEEMDKAAKEYEESPKGQRFIKSIESAREFSFNHYKGLMCSQLGYLANKYNNNLVNGSFDITALAYKQGYTDGKKAARKQRKDNTTC